MKYMLPRVLLYDKKKKGERERERDVCVFLVVLRHKRC